jgi:hypothetical protein
MTNPRSPKRGTELTESDRRLLEGMDARELADISISRSDLPRLYAECAFGSYFYDASVCGMPPAAERV